MRVTHRAELGEVLLKSVAQHHLLVSLSEKIQTELRPVVKQTPLKMALKRRLGASVAPRELDSEYTASRLEPGLLPEERNKTTDLDKGYDAVVNVDRLLRLGKVCHVTFIIHTTYVESAGEGNVKIIILDVSSWISGI